MELVLLVRSFNRPEYLKITLDSLLKSDIDKCIKRYIYDDGSRNNETLEILSNDEYINVPNKEFIVIKESNLGCRLSYCNALNYIKNDNINNTNYYICTVDNDVIVRQNFLEDLYTNYQKAFSIFNTYNLLFTGFNPTNAHQNKLVDYDTFYTKKTCGGVNFFFHVEFIDFIIDNWRIGMDWSVVHKMIQQKYILCCLKKSVINHVGKFGVNSNGNQDRDETDNNFLLHDIPELKSRIYGVF